ncbi:MAG: hypothetical protein NTX65_03895 [Ignavibacteriales bacterium]|nr:hypothetical protein [Ignavibacteriales bacterium]
MKKLNAISLILIFIVSLFIYSCSASGGVSVGKQQNSKTVNLTK